MQIRKQLAKTGAALLALKGQTPGDQFSAATIITKRNLPALAELERQIRSAPRLVKETHEGGVSLRTGR